MTGRPAHRRFQSIGERGFVLDKARWIARHGEFRYVSLQTTDADVRRYPGTAILRCVQRSDATWQGKPMTLNLRVGQVWVKLPGGWKLAAIQFSSLAAAEPRRDHACDRLGERGQRLGLLQLRRAQGVEDLGVSTDGDTNLADITIRHAGEGPGRGSCHPSRTHDAE